VKVQWTREDDMAGGRYRPMYHHAVKAGLDAAGNPMAWRHRIVGQSILAGTPFEAMLVAKGVDGTSVEGAANLPYAVPHLTVDLVTTSVGVPVLWWQSVGSTHTAYGTEVMIDELAAAAGKDPVELVRERAPDQLPDSEAGEEDGDAELGGGQGGAEVGCRRRNRRKIDIDGHRRHRHQGGDQGDEGARARRDRASAGKAHARNGNLATTLNGATRCVCVNRASWSI
jgi:CO/xanthine dehydrogenase Mo-binding subunit